MNAPELKKLFVDFFKTKNHAEIPSASLLPENDPTTLFISAGMHPLVPYLLGQPHPLGQRLTDVQKCVRTGDIEEVGDTYHHTFFEMLGNWSLGDYFKKEAINFSYEFLTEKLKIDPHHIHVTCFAGNNNIPKDTESAQIWESQGLSSNQIHFLPDNWWGPASVTGPCGPDTEMFIDVHPELPPVSFEEGNASGRYLEIWNDVLMQFNKNADGTFTELKQKNIDTGMGVERTLAIINGLDDDYLTDIWKPIIDRIVKISGCPPYDDNVVFSEWQKKSTQNFTELSYKRSLRIIADHIRTAVFMIADGVEPSNKEAGYVLRRLIRIAIRQGRLIGINRNFTNDIAVAVLNNQKNYAGVYAELNKRHQIILDILDKEEIFFSDALTNGLKEINKLLLNSKKPTGKDFFRLYESFGFPVEMIIDELKKRGEELNIEEFNEAKIAHQQQSQTLSAGKFKSGLADHSEIITKYHTATHLLHAALRQVLGEGVQQAGSNITQDRLRFDFTFSDKVSPDQLTEVAKRVNQAIGQKLPVTVATLPYTEAVKKGALAFFGAKYPEIVTMYTVGSDTHFFSREVCTGPHVANTADLGHFEITKEESAGSGKRRIYAVLS